MIRKRTQQHPRRLRNERSQLDEKYFGSTAALKAAMAEAPKIDYERFRADIDAYVDQDPTPRPWPESG